MIIDKVEINKFRGFKSVEFSLGEYVTLIAGQNGTQKSTLLGILTQTFTIPRSGHVFSSESPLTGGTFRSAFRDKFRLSPDLDVAGEHLWTLFFNDHHLHQDIDQDGRFTVESITRKINGKDTVRFWQKGKRDAGSGYVQLPVIFLSLKRLIPIAEAGDFKVNNIVLTCEERSWFSKNYNKILLTRDEFKSMDYLVSDAKNTIGVTTNHYDWNSNSAGQDNVGRILLAVMSFQRLKDNYPEDYKGGVIAIDEIDATLYPGSQVKLFDFMQSCSKDLNLQFIATTHSLHFLEKLYMLKNTNGRESHFQTIYLKKIDGNIVVEENPDYESMVHDLNVSIGLLDKPKRISIYTEDPECRHFLKALLGRKYSNLDFSLVRLGCNNYIQLGRQKVESFSYPNSIVVLDGDARKSVNKAKLKNYICLPGERNPETELASFLLNLSDKSPFWREKVSGYSKQVCFRDYDFEDISTCRKKAKAWYNQQLDSGVWGQQASCLFKYFLRTIPNEKSEFLNKFDTLHRLMN
jgi:predicted ATPase